MLLLRLAGGFSLTPQEIVRRLREDGFRLSALDVAKHLNFLSLTDPPCVIREPTGRWLAMDIVFRLEEWWTANVLLVPKVYINDPAR